MEPASGSRLTRTALRKGKNLPRRAKDLSKEELLLTLQKKRECNAKALKIVEGLLEPYVKEEWLLQVLQHINQSHFQDAVEERAISKLCGYPLCSNELKNVPSQQYRISTRLNKVYDIKERKNFCSNKCFQAANFIKGQMHTSPLWLRDIEPAVNFVLIPSTGLSGVAGDEVNVQVDRISREEVERLKAEKNREEKKAPPSTEELLVEVMRNLHVDSVQKDSPSIISEPTDGSQTVSAHETAYVRLKENLVESNNTKIIQSETGTNIVLNTMDVVHGSEKNMKGIVGEDEKVKCDEMAASAVSKKDPQISFKTDQLIASDIASNEFMNILPDSRRCEAVERLAVDKTIREAVEPRTITVGNDKIPSNSSCVTSPSLTDEAVMHQHDNNLECAEKTENVPKRELIVHQILTSTSECESTSSTPTILSTSHENSLKTPCTLNEEACIDKCGEVLQSSQKVNPSKNYKGGKVSKLKPELSKCVSGVSHVEKCIQEWFTMETMCFLFGESALKHMLEQKGESIQEHYRALRSITWDQEKHKRFLAICKRLNLMEMEDNSFDNEVMKSEAETKRKPLPEYDALKKEAEAMEIKIRAFYQGKTELDEKKVSFAEDVKVDSVDDDGQQIPLVHYHSQRALRKKIVLDGLNRVLPDFLRTFGVRPSEMAASVRGLIGTFDLSPTNITFKPHEWTILGLIVIKLLALRESDLKACLQQEQSKTYLTLMLMSYKQEPEYFDRLLSWLTDIDKLLSKPNPSDN